MYRRIFLELFVAGALLSNILPLLATGQHLCPDGCDCQIAAENVTVRCNQHLPTEKLLAEIDRFLSNQSIDDIRVLEISNTSIGSIPPTVCRMSGLLILDLSDNRLTRLPDNCLNGLRRLERLLADWNNITELQDGLFDGLNDLRIVSLGHNSIRTIGRNVFSNISDLLNLTVVRLHSNALRSLDPWPLMRGTRNATTIFYAVLSQNSISNFTNAVEWRYNCEVTQLVISLEHNSISHVRDLLRGWGIDDTTSLMCLYREHGKFQLQLGRNPFVCDCVDFSILQMMRVFQRSTALKNCFCDAPAVLYGQSMLRIDLMDLECDVRERCPPGCRCADRPANGTLHIDCSSAANLVRLPSDLPALPKTYYRYKIVVRGNRQLTAVEPRAYLSGAATAELDAAECGIETIQTDVWKQLAGIGIVNLQDNRISQLDESIEAVVVANGTLVDLSRNPWSCRCDDRWLKRWLTAIRPHLRNPDAILCSSPPRLRYRNIVSIPDDEFCFDPAVKMAIIVSLATVAFFVVVILAVVVLYRSRHRLCHRWNMRSFYRDLRADGQPDHDVFVCCSTLDDDRGVVELLETNGYRVCCHKKAFVLAAVVRSRRTLCLVTQNFVESAYCMNEFHAALHHSRSAGENRVVLLLMLDDPHQLMTSKSKQLAELRRHLQKHPYIVYGTDGWLQSLMFALPITRAAADAAYTGAPDAAVALAAADDDMLVPGDEDAHADDDVPLLVPAVAASDAM